MRISLEPVDCPDTGLQEGTPQDAQLPNDGRFDRFFARQFPALKRYLTRFVSADDAEELAQEAFLRVYAGDAARISSPSGFLFQTARNLAISHIRHRRVTATVLAKDVAVGLPDGDVQPMDEMLSQIQDLACARAAIASLPARRREIVLMRMKGDLSYAEIADKSGISLKSVESHLARGVEACHEFFVQCKNQGCCGKCKQGDGR